MLLWVSDMAKDIQFILTDVTRHWNGVIEITLRIDGKDYKYSINSEYTLNTFMNYYNMKYYGRALNYIKRWKL